MSTTSDAAGISDAARSYLRWSLADGVGPMRFARIVEHFGSADVALEQSAAGLAEVRGIGRTVADQITRSLADADVAREIAAAAELGVRIICRADPDYPPGLRQIPDAPLVLYVKGELLETDAIAVAIVGSRRCTIYGSEQARRFGELLAGAGFTVVSGLARGIDAFAHHGAVDAGGRTIAVLGAGLQTIYPPENQALADRILTCGAWLSELPLSTSIRRENFPSRNRIIAGMTLGTIVVEAAQRSGALITARLASEYNREVFAVPGRVQDPMSFGTNALIRDGGAKLVADLADVLHELGEVGSTLQRSTGAAPSSGRAPAGPTDAAAPTLFASEAAPPAPLQDAEQRVYAGLTSEPILQDHVIRAAELPAGEVLAALTTLELKGLIKRHPGNLVARAVRGT